MMDQVRVLIYDDNHLSYKTGLMVSMGMESPSFDRVESVTGGSTYIPTRNSVFELVVSNYEEHDNITLDDTLMKRIAKYNKEEEIVRLEDEINKKKKEIEKLDDILKDRAKRVEKLKKYIANIYDIDLYEEEDY